MFACLIRLPDSGIYKGAAKRVRLDFKHFFTRKVGVSAAHPKVDIQNLTIVDIRVPTGQVTDGKRREAGVRPRRRRRDMRPRRKCFLGHNPSRGLETKLKPRSEGQLSGSEPGGRGVGAGSTGRLF